MNNQFKNGKDLDKNDFPGYELNDGKNEAGYNLTGDEEDNDTDVDADTELDDDDPIFNDDDNETDYTNTDDGVGMGDNMDDDPDFSRTRKA